MRPRTRELVPWQMQVTEGPDRETPWRSYANPGLSTSESFIGEGGKCCPSCVGLWASLTDPKDDMTMTADVRSSATQVGTVMSVETRVPLGTV